jgi:RNA polymerase sigma-70 factor (ECF subfamily)
VHIANTPRVQELAAARGGDEGAFRALVAPYQRELRAYCYRMAGSMGETDDLLQESLLRAWRGLPTFEGRSSVRTWLYRVTSSACIDALKSKKALKRAEDIGPASRAGDPIPPVEPDAWIGPCPASLYDGVASPEARYDLRESVSFAFLAALQLLPPRQRAALIACDVLGFTADECAELLDTSVEAINSAVRRARVTIAERTPTWKARAPSQDAHALLTRYIDAWDRADSRALVALLHQDATMSMPPLPLWLHGSEDIARSIGAMVFASAARGTFRAVSTEANGLPALAVYRRDESGSFAPYALQVLGLDGDALRALTAFLDTRIFATFELPATLR